MKKLMIGLVVILVVIAGGVFFLFSNLNSLIQTAVEEAGTRATGVPVTLAKVDIDVTGGSGAMGGLNVANPAGYGTDYVFNLGEIKVTLDVESVTSNPVIIKEVIVTAPKVIYELGDGGSNVDVIKNNVDRFQQSLTGGSSGGSSGASEGEATKVIINDLYVRGTEVSVSAPFLAGEKLGTGVPDIHLKDIGKDDGGKIPAEVASQIIDSILAQVNTAVGSLNLDGLQDAAKAAAEGAVKAVEGAAGEATKALEDAGVSGAGDAVKDATEGAGDAIKGLLGN